MGIFSFFVSSSIKNGSVNSNTLKTHYETELNKYKTEHSNWLESKQQAESTEYVESWRVDQVEKFYQKMIKSFISTVDEDDK